MLRGERSRFQLFGDTVNTAARLESSGEGNQIHISGATASLIMKAGFENWIREREDFVHLKGKGSMKTYWIATREASRDGSTGSPRNSSLHLSSNIPEDDLKTQRLVSWNVEILVRLIRQIVAHRGTVASDVPLWRPKGANPLDEVVEIIHLPGKQDSKKLQMDPNKVELEPAILQLVHEYVAELAKMYHNNPFHNFEHASHVTMSVAKLLSRIGKLDGLVVACIVFWNESNMRSVSFSCTFGYELHR